MANIGTEIETLENRRKIELENYEHSETALGKARINDALDPSKLGNISIVQRPSAPARTFDPAKTKIAGGLAGFGILLGVGMALLMEMVVDHRVKRPAELESRFRIPLMMSIPRIGAAARNRHLALQQKEDEGRALPARLPRGQEPDPLLHGSHFINPYAEAVRDRLGYYFELNNMTHKPKLIALTGLSDGAGTSTLAKGLASAFAEIDDSKVLYLDMNSFQNGDTDSIQVKSSNSLSEDAEDSEDADFTAAGNNLYIASVPANSKGAGSKRLATKKFYDLMPKFRASQFDYIIFDMPMLDATSPTPAMAGFMDQVILVLDAQNTDRDLLQKGYADLTRGNADVTCIFNKTRSQAPRWIQGAA
jgi:succinoglycan biosynthesis transport protein ExoP